MQKHILDAEDAPVAAKRHLGVVDLAALMGRGEEVLLAVLDPFDRALKPHRHPGQHDLLRVEQHDLGSEAAAHERRDHPHLPFAKAKHPSEPGAQEHRRLCGVPHRQPVSLAVPVGHDAARLDRRRRTAVIDEPSPHHMGGLRQRRRVVPLGLVHMGGDVLAYVVVDKRRRRIERRFEIDHRRQRLDVDRDVGEGIFRHLAAHRNHHRQRLADVPHLVAGERDLGALVEGQSGDRRRRHQ